MRKGLLRLSLLGLALASACADDLSSPLPAPTISGDGARIHRGTNGSPLTAPSDADADTIVREFLADHGNAPRGIQLATRVPSYKGVSHVKYEQVIDGLRVHGAYAKAAINDRGELLQVIDNLAPAGALPARNNFKVEDALAVAMAEHGYNFATPAQVNASGNKHAFAKGTEFYREPTVERVAYVDGSIKLGFLVETWSERENQLDHTLVSDTGKIVSTERRTQNDSYNVFTNDPNKTPQDVVNGPGGWLGTTAHTTVNISGPNVRAYLDTDDNNAADGGGTSVSDGNFLTAANLAETPSSTTNKAVSVQNLFYLNNITHDLLEGHGFDNAAGNFEGNDPVNAEAQDGGGTDNANFATPADGSSPRMQMYLWTGNAPSAYVTVGSTDYGAYKSSFGGSLATQRNGALSIVNDGAGIDPLDGCEALPAGSLTGTIAIVNRGNCDFTVKVLNAQKAGAIAAVITNHIPDAAAFSPGGTNRKITIPSAMVTKADGDLLRADLGEQATLRSNPTPALQIDASLDSDIVYHEYGHGLTWRMVGSMSGPLAGALGEGSSDVLAFLINDDDAIAEYSASSALGIRRERYGSYTLTYGAVTGASVHDDGEIWAAAMWRTKLNYEAAGLSKTILLDDFVKGLNFVPAKPTYEAMRDGLLQQAMLANDGRECLVWEAMAHFGLGVGSSATTNRRGQLMSITESFDVPTACQ